MLPNRLACGATVTRGGTTPIGTGGRTTPMGSVTRGRTTPMGSVTRGRITPMGTGQRRRNRTRDGTTRIGTVGCGVPKYLTRPLGS